ncbi:MAG TPA: hypothetical protein VF812_08825 [Ktedonobacterales bacterium]
MGKRTPAKNIRMLSRRAQVIAIRMTLSGLGLGLVGAAILTGKLPDEYVIAQAVFGDTLAPNTIGIGALFASLYLLVACLLSLETARRPPPHHEPLSLLSTPSAADGLTLQGILIGEFEYGRETAAQAMEERRSVTNFYLLVVGGTISGVVALLSTLISHHNLVLGAVAALWLVSAVGLMMLFSIISLRLAWVGSASSMNHVKEFYLHNADKLGASRDILQSAFTYRTDTLPAADVHWNVNHYTALLIGCLDAGAYLSGLTLIGVALSEQDMPQVCVVGAVLTVFVFMAHWWSFDLSLRPLLEQA